MLSKEIVYFGQKTTVSCDGNCNKAWGLNSRPRVQISNDSEDIEWLADDELDDAPEDPGTYEGSDRKPLEHEEKLNRWCVRECERSVLTRTGENLDEEELHKWSKRVRNIDE